jgi:RNase H-like domain found in reverse transcriptase
MQWDDDNRLNPIAFASAKLSGAQLAWTAIEKEACAIMWLLNKFRTRQLVHLLLILYSQIRILLRSLPRMLRKNAKLTRWILAYSYGCEFFVLLDTRAFTLKR